MNKTIQVLVVFFGTVLMGIGIQIVVIADVGVDSVSTLILGLMNYTTVPFDRWSQLISAIFLIITFFYFRKLIGIGSLINTIVVGETIRYIKPFCQALEGSKCPIGLSLVGFLILALGTAIYLTGNLGTGPLEGIMLSVCKIFNVSIRFGRILIDLIIVLVGVCLGGEVGVGTLFAIFFLGPTIQFMLFALNFKKTRKSLI